MLSASVSVAQLGWTARLASDIYSCRSLHLVAARQSTYRTGAKGGVLAKLLSAPFLFDLSRTDSQRATRLLIDDRSN